MTHLESRPGVHGSRHDFRFRAALRFAGRQPEIIFFLWGSLQHGGSPCVFVPFNAPPFSVFGTSDLFYRCFALMNLIPKDIFPEELYDEVEPNAKRQRLEPTCQLDQLFVPTREVRAYKQRTGCHVSRFVRCSVCPTAEGFGVSAQIGSGVVRGG